MYWPIVIILALLVCGSVLWVGQALRRLAFCREQVSAAWRQLSDELSARREMMPYIVSAVPVSAAQLVEAIGNACDLASHVSGVRESAQAEARLTMSMKRLFALLDAEPAEGGNVNRLRGKLDEIETRIDWLRDCYNRQAETFNALLKRGPARLLAHLPTVRQAELF